jgi:branched-chain amino acid transport system substrate-binding protein
MTHKTPVLLLFAWLLVACMAPAPAPPLPTSTVVPSPTPSLPPQSIRIALILPTEGFVAEEGLAALRGARLAIERRNSEGGVLGLSIEAVNFDSRCTAEGGRRATSETREQELTLLVGGLCASDAIAMSELMTGESVFLSLNAHPLVAVDDSGLHRQGVYVIPLPDVLQAQAMARYAREYLHAQTAATLYDERSSLGANLTGTFSQVFLEEGGEIAQATTYSGLVTDYTAQLAPIAAVSPDVLFLPNCAPEVNVAAAQARQMGIDATLLGCDSWDGDLDERAVESGYYCTGFTVLDPKVQAFVEAYRTRFDGEADVFAALGYEAARILLDAIQEAGSTQAPDVQQALLVSTFQSWTGPITFDEVGQAHRSLALVRVEDGARRFVAYIFP